jgi:hypothetical protein
VITVPPVTIEAPPKSPPAVANSDYEYDVISLLLIADTKVKFWVSSNISSPDPDNNLNALTASKSGVVNDEVGTATTL